MLTKHEYACRDLIRAILGFKREPRFWYCCGFTVRARSRKNARREFERKGIAAYHANENTINLKG